jgi:DNA-binding NarL/FixJ family response regulator
MTVVAEPHIRHIERPEHPGARTRVLIVDDHAAVRAGLRELLDGEPDFEVVAAAEGAEAAMLVAEREPVDVAVVDYQLGARTGLWLSRKLKRLPSPPAVLIYSAYADGVLAAASVVAEADALLSKGGLGSELCDEIRRISRGGLGLRELPEWLEDAVRARYSPEEQAIFGMLLAGVTPAEIARTLELSAAGLESRLDTMLRKLQMPYHQQRLADDTDDVA